MKASYNFIPFWFWLVQVRLILIFFRSKEDYKFTKTKLAERLGTSRQNIQNQIKSMLDEKLLWHHKDGYELNLYVDTFELRMKKEEKSENRRKGKLKRVETNQNMIDSGDRNNESERHKNNAVEQSKNETDALNSITSDALNNNAIEEDQITSEMPINTETEENSPFSNNTNIGNYLPGYSLK